MHVIAVEFTEEPGKEGRGLVTNRQEGAQRPYECVDKASSYCAHFERQYYNYNNNMKYTITNNTTNSGFKYNLRQSGRSAKEWRMKNVKLDRTRWNITFCVDL